ncbi:MAG: sulfide/dihydroorotate dehydrogenase-like FAD/NAD-binding protein [Prevotellaceae bacterium]|jgi:ferredoxin--NADP+ reductase|nr:sulfide/dihydroorotate dehydrogenase-like FAD/NAD-binding protein [Prevotellaceae bacterium]
MFEITKKQLLAENIYLMDVAAPRVAKSAQPGQFVIVRVGETGERIPLTICDYNAGTGAVTIVTQVVGASSRKICALGEGDSFTDFVGPLGCPSELVHLSGEALRQKSVLFIAGGLGAAPVYPQVKWLCEQGAKADVIVGAKSRDFLILQPELAAVARNLHVATDDGSTGFKGLVTELLKHLIDVEGKKYDIVVAIGPMIMMKFVALATKAYGIATIVSLNTLMVDGTGMCGACRVSVGGKTRFTCVDGPEFDGHLVDFDEALRRQGMYRAMEKEKEAECKCLPA